jgi:hypothetical protein
MILGLLQEKIDQQHKDNNNYKIEYAFVSVSDEGSYDIRKNEYYSRK